MDIIAKAKFIRISPKKIRLVAKPISKMTPQKAMSVLKFSDKSVAYPMSKLINSAIANAKNNFGLKESDLSFKSIEVGQGPTFKRYRAASRGRVHSILKRTSNITVILQGEQVKKAADLEQKIVKTIRKIPKQDEAVTTKQEKEMKNHGA